MAFAQWQWVNPLPTGSPLSALTWDGSQFVAFDSSDAVLMSADGVSWSNTPSGRTESISALVWGNGLYVAAGTDSGLGLATVLTSPDGSTWTAHGIGVPINVLSQALWNADLQQFVLIADSGVILTSSNGTDWAPQASGTLNDLYGVAWGNGRYVVVGAHGTVLTSSNGSDWADHSIAGSDEPLLSVAANGNLFAVVRASSLGNNDQSTILTNSDPSDPTGWAVAFGVVDPSTQSQLTRIVWDGAAFVAIGGIIATSPDGDVWTYVADGISDVLRTVAFSNDQIVVADSSGDILVSPLDGLGWSTSSSNLTTDDIEGVIWNGSYFGAVTDFGSFLSSTDGVNWQVNNFALPIAANAVAWGNGTLVAVGEGGIASSADDGFTWNPSTNHDLFGVTFYGVTWGDGQFVAVGSIIVPDPPFFFGLQQGVVFTSPDGTSWTARTSNAIKGDSIHGVVWAGNQFVAVGATSFHANDGDLQLGPPSVFTSPDGSVWTRATPFDPLLGGRVLLSIAWSGSQFVAVGTPGLTDDRAIATSSDGTTWEYVFPLPAEIGANRGSLRSVAWTGNRFVTIGTSSAELTSPDGHIWTAHATGAGSLNAVAASGTQCIAAGDFGSIMREDSLCNADQLFKSGFE